MLTSCRVLACMVAPATLAVKRDALAAHERRPRILPEAGHVLHTLAPEILPFPAAP